METTPRLTLYSSPRACSTGCHIALADSGLAYDLRLVRIRNGEHRQVDFLRINPRGKVPVLDIGGQILTESHAILSYVADASGAWRSFGALERARAHEWMNFVSSTVHIAFRPLTRPAFFVDDAALFPALREAGIPRLRDTVLEVDRRLADRRFALGEAYSVVDAYLQVFWIWSQRDDIRPHLPRLPHWQAQAERIFERPATWAALAREGITPDNIRDP